MKHFLAILYILTIFFIIGCSFFKKNPTNAPSLPDKSTFTLNIKAIDSTVVPKTEDTNYRNWYIAFLNYKQWKNFITTNLYLPLYAINSCYNVVPTFFADKIWVRQVDFADSTNTYAFSLFSTYNVNSSVNLEMQMKINNSSVPITIISGYEDYDSESGYWIFNKYISNSLPYLRIDWNYAYSFNSLIFTNLSSNSDFMSSKLTVKSYSSSINDYLYNLSLDFYNSKTMYTTNVQLDTLSYSGRIRDSLVYGDTLWHYWQM